jgi:hypothetical protein
MVADNHPLVGLGGRTTERMDSVVSAAPPREKDPRRIRAGKAGMLARWGPGPRVVRLTDLDPVTADIIRAILAARANASPPAGQS